ncbi:RNA-directed DNA polymerase (reversetranscriptase)-related family protein [Striga asiatica]|uniref:RNA-directed DNA polymerase (Reversetranscriptase)-related family protein n=1 Tax=Striga asiatica TaxID=4170 RepID=A0A5A7P850_STRAF|nr:RNA-directed DNA polymerase (reversetranscriptase)-related family protein [Striga asiatica]
MQRQGDPSPPVRNPKGNVMGEGSHLNVALIEMTEVVNRREEREVHQFSEHDSGSRRNVVVEDRGSAKKNGKEVVVEITEGEQAVSKGESIGKSSKLQIGVKAPTMWKRKGQSRGRLKRTDSPMEIVPAQGQGKRQRQCFDQTMEPGDGRAWNRELIQNLFTEASCKAILEIKGLDPAARDKWVWTSDVKAYAVAVKKKILSLDMPGCSSNINADKKARMRCWNLRVKGKIQHFIWRCFTDCLPVSANLRIRGMQLDNVCQCCGESVETVEHVMFTCSRAAMVWSLVPVSWDSASIPCVVWLSGLGS